MRAIGITLAWASVALTELPAQQQPSDVVPRELAVALLDRWGMSQNPVEIVVGRRPESFPADALPRERIRVLGGSERDEGGASVVAELPEAPDSARARLASHLDRAGWRSADMQRHFGGFVPNTSDMPARLCRGNAVLSYTVRARPGRTGSLLHVSVVSPEPRFSCSREAEEAEAHRSMRMLDYPTMPLLEAPPNARMTGSGSSGGGRDAREVYTRLETTQSAASVGAHYADLIRRAGWVVGGPVQAEGIVLYRAERLDDENGQLTGALAVLAVAGGKELDVSFRIARRERRR
ncbi:MAG TPA: hypothetical protein VJ802_13470 [Gemmatimonadaceae bacterium]|nr:hypothetical protein [Gemmatimonadaceae bacterium]